VDLLGRLSLKEGEPDDLSFDVGEVLGEPIKLGFDRLAKVGQVDLDLGPLVRRGGAFQERRPRATLRDGGAQGLLGL
jgi:hypothetical protein